MMNLYGSDGLQWQFFCSSVFVYVMIVHHVRTNDANRFLCCGDLKSVGQMYMGNTCNLCSVFVITWCSSYTFHQHRGQEKRLTINIFHDFALSTYTMDS